MIFPKNFVEYINDSVKNPLVEFKPLEIMMINIDREEIDTNL